MAELKVDPPTVTFNAPFASAKSAHQMTNGGSTKVTTKVKCTRPDLILANPVFAVVDPGQSAKLTLHGRFKDGPDAKQAYRVYVQYAEAPADTTPADDQQKLKQAWAAIKDPKTHKLPVEFNPPLQGDQPAAPAAEPAPAEAAPAEPAPDAPAP